MNPGRVANMVALITGAGSGIGRSTAVLLAKEGGTVIVADIDLDAARNVANKIIGAGGEAEAVELDVADESTWDAAIRKVMANHERFDVLVNNAGVSISKLVAESSLDDWRKVMSVNLDGVFLGTKHAIAAMKNGDRVGSGAYGIKVRSFKR